MSFNTEGEKCPVCHAYLFEEDDVVYCPTCGAPHHRECYNSIGKCGLSELHGTDAQYDVAKAAAQKAAEEKKSEPAFSVESDADDKCRMCGNPISREEKRCPKCGAPNVAAMDGFATYDFLGGVPGDMDIGEGVTANEAKRFVAANTPRYIPKFASMKTGKKLSWNWAAFLFPCEWLCARKMYIFGIIVGILTVAASLMSVPMLFALESAGILSGESMYSASNISAIADSIGELGNATILLMMAGVVFDLAIRLIVALFGDWWYRNQTISCIKRMRAESEDMDRDYRRLGGVNLYALLIAIFATQYLPSILINFLR